MWRCGPQTTGKCNENIEHFFEVLPCERFHRDVTGPWAFISDGMSLHSKCGANAVNSKNFQIRIIFLFQKIMLNFCFCRVHLIWSMHN